MRIIGIDPGYERLGIAVIDKLTKGKEVLFLEPTFWYPRALFLIQLFASERDWLKPLTLKTMTPQYLRTPEAEDMFRKIK